MNRMMNTATNTMGQLQLQIDNISHNMNNLSTTGYKRREANFQELMYQQFNNAPKTGNQAPRNTPVGIRYGVGAKLGHTNLQFEQGAINQTSRSLDVALSEPNHFFQISVMENGQVETRYTRDGSFQLAQVAGNPNLMHLSTSEGYPVLGADGNPIYIPGDAGSVAFSDDGSLVITARDGSKESKKLSIVNINKPHILQTTSGNLYKWPNNVTQNGVVTNVQDTKVFPGALEQSNVNVGEEMSELMMTQRSYQFNSRIVSMGDQMMGLINELK